MGYVFTGRSVKTISVVCLCVQTSSNAFFICDTVVLACLTEDLIKRFLK